MARSGGEELQDLLTVVATVLMTNSLPRLEREARLAAVRLMLRRLATAGGGALPAGGSGPNSLPGGTRREG